MGRIKRTLSKEEVEKAIKDRERFIRYVVEVFAAYLDAEEAEGAEYLDPDTVYFSNDTVHARGEDRWQYGGYEKYSYEMPIEALWNPQLIKDIYEEREAEKRAAAEAEEADKIRRGIEQENRDYRQYQYLKKKFDSQ